MTGKSILAALLFSFATFTQAIAQCDCVTTGNCPVPITDNGVFNGYMDVTVNGPNDLAVNPLTKVCVTITHTWIGDLSISLTSPSGVEYLIMADGGNNYGDCGTQQDNAEICIVPGTGNPLTNNTDYMCNTAPCSVGTCCLNGNFTVPCGGVTSPITGALQAPNCNLNDFNIPGQPANGTWTISVLDVCNMDVGVLENFSLTFANGQNCYACESDGGVLDSISLVSCVGDSSLLLDLPPDYGPDGPSFGADSADYGYVYVLVQNNIILSIDSVVDLSSHPPGSYHVYGFSYLLSQQIHVDSLIGMNYSLIENDLESSTAAFCGDFSDNAVPVTILPPLQPTVINQTVCQGSCITVGGQQVCASGTFSLDSWQGCDSTVQVNLTIVHPDTVEYAQTVCTGNCVTIGGQQYCTTTQQYIHLQNLQGCDSVVHLTLSVLSPIAVITPANPPALTCTNTAVLLSAATSGPGMLTYAWSGPSAFTNNQPSISVTLPGTYSVTVSNNSVTPACTSTASATVANNMMPPDLVFNGVPPSICLGESFDLVNIPIQDLNNTASLITIHSGTPATPANQLFNTTVSPTANTTYYYKATKGNCTDVIGVMLLVKPLPTADFTATTPSCLNSNVTVAYTGTAGPGATYNWFFDTGTATPGTGQGPHTVTFPFAGPKSLTLTVEENGCTSDVAIQNITVESPLATPVINCTTTTSSITFTWTAVPGSTGYNLTPSVLGTLLTPTSYQVTGLIPGQSVSLQVEAIGAQPCGNSSAQQTCVAANCLPMTVTISPVADICLDASTAPFNLQATVTGGSGTGTFTWSGSGITNTALGSFDPSQATFGANNISVTYTEGNCSANNSTSINVYQTPTAGLAVVAPVCANNAAVVTYTGTTGPGLIYTWDFDGGVATPGTGPGAQNVTWSSPGSYTVTLTVENANGCVSTPATAAIQVDAPLAAPNITCSPSTTSITFTWPAVAGAIGYSVNVTTGQIATQNTPTSYTIAGLTPNELVSIEVTALGSNSCGNSMASVDCAAMDCPVVGLTIDPVADICLDVSTVAVQLVSDITGGSATGSVQWVGTGVSSNGLFNPNQANLGVNTITAIYTDGPCNVTKDININVYQTPTGGFAAPAAACMGSAVVLSYSGTAQAGDTYNWDFGGGTAIPGTGPGPHNVTWATAGQKMVTLTIQTPQGCISPIYTSLVQVASPLQAPQISCDNTTTSIEFTWPSVPGATAYSVSTSTGQIATQTAPTTWEASGLQPLEQVCVTVTASSGGACPNVSTQLCCNAEPCPNIQVSVAPVADFCLGTATPIQLQATVTGSDGSGSGNWSGPGVINTSLGTFSPVSAGFGQHTINYTFVEQGCIFVGSTVIGVYQQPNPNFNVEDVICLSNFATVNLVSPAGANAVYTWDFDGGTASPGTGSGPHQVQWSTPGLKTITLSIVDGSCSSTVFTDQVQVDDQLAQPLINCTATTDGVIFTWTPVPNATNYVVVGPGGQATTDTSYVFTGLDPGESVAIQVAVVGTTSCPTPPVQANCNALPCSNFVVVVDPVTPICLTATSAQVQLAVDVDGVGLAGNGTWSGEGVVDPALGIFDPTVASIGIHQITYTYQQVNCSYQDEIEIEIVSPPTADAGPDRLITCWESDQTIQLGGSGTSVGPDIGYLWTAATGIFPGMEHVQNPTVEVEGLFTLTATNTALGCFASDDVLVVSTKSEPVPTVTVDPIHCSGGGHDANVTISNVTGGMDPFLYSLNGEPFVGSNTFPFLDEGEYELTIIDAEGCTGTASFRVDKTGTLDVDLTANIVGQAVVTLGESISLTALTNLPESELDSIQWTNGGLLSCTDCLDPIASPLSATNFTITVYKDGCRDSDNLDVLVKIPDSPVYIPSAFSPNDDGTNDLFRIYPGPTVTRVKSFLIFDRWGELVYEYKDFDPKDPANGWNGKLDDKPMNPAVFAWFAEIEFLGGTTQVLEGDVTLIR